MPPPETSFVTPLRRNTALFLCFGFACVIARGQTNRPQLEVSNACHSINVDALHLLDQAKLDESEEVIRQALAQDRLKDDRACAFLLWDNLARVLSAGGRDTAATAAAERSVDLLNKLTEKDDPVRLVPLGTLWSLCTDEGEVAKARQVFQQLLGVRLESPVQRAIFLTVAGGQAVLDGEFVKAEKNYLSAIEEWETAGKANSVEAALLLDSLAGVYLHLNRLADADARISQSVAMIKSAQGAVPVDVIRIYDQQAVVYAREQRWDAARVELKEIVELSETMRLDPSLRKTLLTNYAYVLRRDHRRKEAQAIASSAAVIRAPSSSDALVDISEFRGAKAGRKMFP